MAAINRLKALLPIREKSNRIPGKNFKPFNGVPLFHIMIKKLQACNSIEEIIINTDSLEVKNYAKEHPLKLQIIDRPEGISQSSITMNTLIDYDLQQIPGEHFLQTHVTNPLLMEKTIENAIGQYFSTLGAYDSMLAVDKIQKRLYDAKLNPINHSNSELSETQHLPSVFAENSNLFIFSRTSFLANGKSRVGQKPQIYQMSAIEGQDIDDPEDFVVAELIAQNMELFPSLS